MRWLLALLTCTCVAGQEPVFLPEPPWYQLGPAPLRVMASSDLDEYAESVSAAVRFWNRELGCDVFVLYEGIAPDVIIELGGNSSAAAGSAQLVGGHALVLIFNNGLADITIAYLVLAHELGHVLGLAHDYQRNSVMYRRVTDVWPLMVTDADRAALKARYCRSDNS